MGGERWVVVGKCEEGKGRWEEGENVGLRLREERKGGREGGKFRRIMKQEG